MPAAKQRRAETKILPISAPLSDRAPVVDEFGRLSTQLEALRPVQARHEQLRQRIADWYAAADPAQCYSEDGAQYSVQVGPKASKRSVSDLALIYDRLGASKFLQISTISLEKLDTVMLPSDQADCVRIERTGPRTVRPVPKFAEPAA